MILFSGDNINNFVEWGFYYRIAQKNHMTLLILSNEKNCFN